VPLTAPRILNHPPDAAAVPRSITAPASDAERLALGGTTNAAAYDAYLRGAKLRRDARVAADFRAALAELDWGLGSTGLGAV
jgi:hypothetical protein